MNEVNEFVNERPLTREDPDFEICYPFDEEKEAEYEYEFWEIEHSRQYSD